MEIILKKTSLILIAISLIACELGSDYPLANKNKENKRKNKEKKQDISGRKK